MPYHIPESIGWTLREYAAAVGTHPQAARPAYTAMFRDGEGLSLPPPTRETYAGGVHKYCLPAGNGEGEIESVVIPMDGHHGNRWHTLCVSSQVGCKMGCTFCETGRMGLRGNLTAAEIVAQRLSARRMIPPADILPTAPPRQWTHFSDGIANVVFMGMGEPLDNFEAVLQAIRVLNEPAGLNIPLSQITISTVGRIDGIRRLAAQQMSGLRIAVSLNAGRDDLRSELMPVNRRMPLEDLRRALLDYPLSPQGRFLIEYVLIKGVNDSLADADLVAAWCRPLRCVVNLIPYNPQRDASYEAPSEETLFAFLNRLKVRGQFAKHRLARGQSIMGACGQLGNSHARKR